MTDELTFEVDDRLRAAAEEWSEARLTDFETALETKVEQALLEIEHLVSDATDVSFEVEDATVRHRPSDGLAAFLADQSAATGLDESEILKLHVGLFARVFLEDDAKRPPNAPPTDDG
ncbi:hypothetical protein NGM10_09165 [Halorussus salilacus]|uniref:hypothetical protein n=1 Tax=Halorussus salilacus TaxID=2953750 RepID=UPI00209E38C6|nr:hypothetical protein [Halorussus salilacus]USZ66900.1 hypothetical protein NGM10_09165 [Halorussus salilacus]